MVRHVVTADAAIRSPSRNASRSANHRRRCDRKLLIEPLENRRLLSSSLPLASDHWTALGPAPITNGQVPGGLQVSGRIAAVAADPSDPNTIYVAAAGVWKTSDGGSTWSAKSDTQQTLVMGALAIAPSNPQVIYAGTGEAHNSGDSFYGRGVLKSTDAGATWTLLGNSQFDRHTIAKVVVDPQDANRVYVAVAGFGANGLNYRTKLGIWRSVDGGVTWTRVLDPFSAPVSGTNPQASDLVMDPTSTGTTGVLYAAFGNYRGDAGNGVYKSTDGGANWALAGDFPRGTDQGRMSLAISKSSPSTLYASLQNPSTYDLLAIYKTINGGTNWTATTTPQDYMDGQGWYDQTIAVDPTNADVVYAGGAGDSVGSYIVKSSDGGATWTTRTQIRSGTDGHGPHADHHAIDFDANGKLLVGTDGGLWRLTNPTVGSIQWTNLNGNVPGAALNTIQFTGIALHPTNADIAYGGSQDNGTEKFNGALGWSRVRGGDGGFVRVDRTNPNTVYHTYQQRGTGGTAGSGFLERSDNAGSTWASKTSGITSTDPSNFYIPYALDASNTSRLVLGTNRVYVSTNRGDSWSPISTSGSGGWTASSKIDAVATIGTTVYATTNGSIFVTTNGGTSWTLRNAADADEFADLQVDPLDPNLAYAVRNRFGGTGKVYRTTNAGATWTNITGNLPNLPAWSLESDTRGPGTADDVLYVGTDDGVYQSTNLGATWSRLGTGLPNVQVVDLDFAPSLGVLAAGTHGRGLWELITTEDFGDAPTSAQTGFAGTYPTTLASDGARHVATGPRFGANRDLEGDGQPALNADGDDANGGADDEDGLSVGTLRGSPTIALTGSVAVELQAPDATANILNAWIDFNRDGDWDDSGEQVFTNRSLGTTAGTRTLDFTIPAGALAGTTYARFRLSTVSNLTPNGEAPNGEVEDCPVTISVATMAPSGVDLVAGSDTGTFDADDLTKLDNHDAAAALQFVVLGTLSGALVTVYAEGSAIGTAIASGVATTVTTSGTLDLADGGRFITATQTEPGKLESEASPALSVTIDTRAPAAATGLDLAASADTGFDNGDNLTKNTSGLTIGGAGESAATVELFADANNDGVVDAGESLGTTLVVVEVFAKEVSLAAGTHMVRATQTDAAGNTGTASVALSITVDTTPPAVSVNALSTNDTTPLITGTASDGMLQVVVNGESYAAGDGNLTVTGTDWTLQIPTGDTLSWGTYDVAVTATDAAGNVGNDAATDELRIVKLIVTSLTPTRSGFVAQFSGEFQLDGLNLYDGAGGTLGAADVVLQDAAGQILAGSLVVDRSQHAITFVKTGDVLPPAVYTVSIRSGLAALRDLDHGPLDGDNDGTTGDDFTASFSVASSTDRVVSIPDIARGAGQPVNIPNTAAGLPIRLDNAAGVTSLALDLVYDQTLLEITAAALAAGLPGDWTLVNPPDISTPGVAKIRASGATPLSGANLEIVRLTAAVPNDAAYGAIQAIRLDNVSLNAGEIAVIGDVAVHKAVYLGDADGSGMHSSVDAFLTVQAALGLADGFAAHAWTDPRIVGDADGSGMLGAADAFLTAQEGLGLVEPFVPDNPHISVTPVGGAVDPQFQIGVNLVPDAAGRVLAPVTLAIEPAATNVGAFDFDLFFDSTQLTIQVPGGVSAGADTGGWAMTADLIAPGQLRVGMVSSHGSPLEPGLREIARLQFHVKAGKSTRSGWQPVPTCCYRWPVADYRLPSFGRTDAAEPHSVLLNIEPVDPRAGGYTWTDTDGSVMVRPAARARAADTRQRIWRDMDAKADLLESVLADPVHEIATARR